MMRVPPVHRRRQVRHDVEGGVHERKVRERLREVPEQALRPRVVLLRQQSDVGRESEQALEEVVGVVVPADESSMEQAVQALIRIKTPAYLRAGRAKVPVVYPDGCPFKLGKANQLRDGKDITLIANGLMVAEALKAADTLAGQGVQARVLDMHTVKPCDDAAILAAAKETGRIVVAEEHLAHGGLGSVVAMSAARQQPVPMRFVNLGDTFAESGTPEELIKKYGMTADAIVKAARELK